MAMKITAGIGRKLGLPEYSSTSASCHVEFEAEQNLLGDPIAFRQRVSAAFAACRDAVAEELARQKAEPTGNGTGPSAANGSSHHGAAPSADNGNGHRSTGNGHAASDKQLDFARQLAKAIQGLGVRRLEILAQKMFGKPLAALSSLEASGLIDTLKSAKAGKIDLNQVLEGTAP
jgi:hypothetical protein